MDKKISTRVSVFLLFIVYLVIGAVFIRKMYPFAILPDEFGYWQNVACFEGVNWSEVNAIGDYYSYGYSSFLFPVFVLVKSPLIAYRTALWVNLVMLIIGGCAIYKVTDCSPYLLLLYPPMIYYALTTMSEAALFMMFAISLYVLKRYLESGKALLGILLIVLLVFLFTIHMRTLPLVIIAVLLMRDNADGDKGGRKGFITTLVVALVLLALAVAAGIYFQQPIIAANGAAGTGFYGVLSKMKGLYSISGIGKYILSVIGEVFYIGVASIGLGYLGIIRIIRRVRDKQDFEYFLLVSLICEMAVSALFLYSEGSSLSVIYGRYIDFMIPVLVAMGVMEIIENDLKIKELIISLMVLMLSSVVSLAGTMQYEQIDDMFALGANYMNVSESSHVKLIVVAAGLSILFLLLCFAAKRIGKGSKAAIIMAVILAVSFLAFSLIRCVSLVERNANYARENAELADTLRQDDERMIIYIAADELPIIQELQFMMPDKTIKVVSDSGELEEYAATDKFIVVMSYDTINEQLASEYELYAANKTFKVWK